MNEEQTAQEFHNFIKSHSRWQRYRLAQKTLKFRVYKGIEAYVLASFVLSLFLPWVTSELVASLLNGNIYLVAVAGLLHHTKLAGGKPWLLLAAAFEAFVLWGIYNWGISHYLALPNFGVFCVFVFVFRYWQRGEHEVNVQAFENILSRAQP